MSTVSFSSAAAVSGVAAVTMAGMNVGTVPVNLAGSAAAAAAVHQMPSVIAKPRIYVTQPSMVSVAAAANGPSPHVTNGAHMDIKREKDG